MKTIKFLREGGIFTLLLTLLGLASCEGGGRKVMYGCPNADYKIKASLVDKQGVAVAGVEVGFDNETKCSDDSGVVNFEKNAPAGDIGLHVRDIDGPANGQYIDSLYTVKISDKDYISAGDDNWYTGVVKKDVTLKLKKQGE